MATCLYDIEKGEGKCWLGHKLLLDGFIIQAGWEKVNGFPGSFIIYLQLLRF